MMQTANWIGQFNYTGVLSLFIGHKAPLFIQKGTMTYYKNLISALLFSVLADREGDMLCYVPVTAQ